MSAEKNTYDIPLRKDVLLQNTWDLTALYKTEADWDADCRKIEQAIESASHFEGTIGSSSDSLRQVLSWLSEQGMIIERVYQYAFLCHAADGGSSEYQRRRSVAVQLYTQFSSAVSFIEPEIMAIATETIMSWIQGNEFDDYRIMVTKLLRGKPHILSKEEEKILAMQGEIAQKAQDTFGALTNVDFTFGHIQTTQGKIPLTQSTYAMLLQNPDRTVREKSYKKFYQVFDNHKHTLATLYETSVKQDIFRSKVRKYSDSRTMFLFPDKVDPLVYDNLISSVHDKLYLLHRYYAIRKKMLNLDRLAHYDVYVPLVQGVTVSHTYEQAVEVICTALAPLGDEYVQVLRKGLTEERWVDRYENKGKRAGAFSSGIYTGLPYILMNYKEDVLRDVFTLAHEGGHSMHTYYSAKNNPFSSYDYTIFEAEVASTFNEQLLASYLFEHAENRQMAAYVIGKQIDDVVATLYRQTMFAEFELLVHQQVEKGIPITVESLRETYRSLLSAYFGSEVFIPKAGDLECLRIPHFYRAFYVYKYATGISASIALAQKVMHGTNQDRDAYMKFLSSGGSHYPIDSLKIAGVDMSSPDPIYQALDTFESLLDTFESLI